MREVVEAEIPDLRGSDGLGECLLGPVRVGGLPSLLGNTSTEGSIGRGIRPRIDLTAEVIGTWRVSPFFERGIMITPAFISTSFHRRFANSDFRRPV